MNTDAHGWSCWIFTRHQLQQDIATVVIRRNMLKMSCHVVFRCYNWTNFVLWTKKKCYHQSSYFLTVNTWHCEMICMNLQGLRMIVRPLSNVNSLMRSELSRITLDNQRDNASSYFCFLKAISCKFHIIYVSEIFHCKHCKEVLFSYLFLIWLQFTQIKVINKSISNTTTSLKCKTSCRYPSFHLAPHFTL